MALAATLQTTVMLGKLAPIRDHAPSANMLGSELSWTAFQFSPPAALRQHDDADDEKEAARMRRLAEEDDIVERVAESDSALTHVRSQVVQWPVDDMLGSSFWLWMALGFAVIVHVPVYFLSRRRDQQHRKKNKALGALTHLLPRAELYMFLLSYQGLAQAAIACMTDSSEDKAFRLLALVNFIFFPDRYLI